MPLSPDTRVGAYRITARIGAGGMGEVYRARDLTLERREIRAWPHWLSDGDSSTQNATELRFVLNRFEELKARVPVK